MKIITVIGARPQFVKAAAVSREIAKNKSIKEVIVHTGQHFDDNMSEIFFRQMEIPKPQFNLAVAGGGHGAMTGEMLIRIESVLKSEKPDAVMVYGDTNSTLAGALAAAKLHIPVAHVEAGLRSFNMRMPEEVNRVLTDRVSTHLYCPTYTAVKNLINEGYEKASAKIICTGDVMQDAAIYYAANATRPESLSQGVVPDNFVLTTIHRAENTDSLARLKSIISALNYCNQKIPVVLPLHPRTKSILEKHDIKVDFSIIEPVGYFEMIWLLNNCRVVMTDSGGVQKEAYFFQKPCITMRDQTEWVELIEAGVNVLVGANYQSIIDAFEGSLVSRISFSGGLYGGGEACSRIVENLVLLAK